MKKREGAVGLFKTGIVGLATLASVSSAADRLWDGGGSNAGSATWNTAVNWDGDATVPGADDALYFGGTWKLANTNDLPADTSFAGLTFNTGAGAFTLLGNRLTLGGNVTNWATTTQTINLPLTLSGTRDFNASNGSITVNGALSGAGGLTKTGPQWLTLNASNSFDGAFTVSKGTLQVNHANALGSTNGNTVIQGTAGGFLRLGSGLTIAEPLVLNGEFNNGGTLNSSSGTATNILAGPIVCTAQPRFQVGSGTLIVSGGVTQSDGGGLFVINSSSTMIFNTTPLSLGSKIFYTDAGGLTVLGVGGNTWSETMVAGGTLRLDAPNVLPAAASLRVGVGYQPSGTLNLNGNSQTTSKLYPGTVNAGTRTITSPSPAILTVNQSVDTTFDGSFTGAAGLCKTGAGKLTLTNAATSTTGSYIVSNGTLVVTAASTLGNSTNIFVAGGTLELQNGTALSDVSTVAILDGGAKLKIGAGLTEAVGRLYLGVTPGTKGTYGATGSGALVIDDAHFSGTGLLSVLQDPLIIPTNYVWDATGPDTLLSTAANWAGDVAPALDGTSILSFGSGGSTATVNTNASPYGLIFNRDANFTVANGDGAVTLGLGGITAYAPTATARAYTLAEDVTLGTNQTWNVTNQVGGTTLTVSGVIGAGANVQGLMKTGSGTLVLAGNNTFEGVITNWCGGIQIAHSNALGSTAGGTVINTAGASSAWLSLYGGITLAEPLTFIGGSVNGGCVNNYGGTNTISGLITTAGGRYVAGNGTVLNITGGVTGPNPFFVVNAQGPQGTIAFTKTPLNLGTGTFHTDSGGLTILGVASNKWGDTLFTGGTLRMDAAYAFPTSTLLKVGGVWYGPSCTLDLNGFDQTVANLSRAEPTPGTIVITSPTPATLTVNQSGNYGYDGRFAGAVTLVKNGPGTLTLTNAATSTAGSFVVSNGTLVVGSDGTLGNNSKHIVVGGTGTLTLQNSKTLPDTAKLTVANGGGAKVNLAAGVNEAVGRLYLGDKQRRVGTYGSTSSAAAVKDDTHFAGTGILTVLRDDFGTLISVQ
jgi:autotransporter-associated beta strand protein